MNTRGCTKDMSQHKYYNVIVAYSTGRTIQYKFSHCEIWYDYDEYSRVNFNDESIMWRIKPVVNRYRVAKMLSSHNNTYYAKIINEHDVYTNKLTALDIEASADFIEWLTDWVDLTE
jgi:hypothetical protein